MRLFDCFLFNDELDLLELRLMETQDVVDRWVLVECPTNWQQKQKRLYYSENIHRFWPWRDRIEHRVLYEHPWGPYPVIEWFQRRALANGWEAAGAEPGDMILVSDVDEIPHAGTLDMLKDDPMTHGVVLQQYLHYYTVNCLQRQPWNGPIGFRLDDGVEYDVQAIRDRRNRLPVAVPGGWHFSWLGSVEQIQYKLGCHTSAAESGGAMVPPDASNVEFLTKCVETGLDIFGRTDEYAKKQFVPITPGHHQPTKINEWLALHPEYAHVYA